MISVRDDSAIIRAVQAAGVNFVLIGGHAVNVHGYTRATEDVDLVWQRNPESEKALLSALHLLDACYIGKDIDPATGIERTYPVSIAHVRGSHMMLLCTRYGFLDMFDFIPGLLTEDVNQLFESVTTVDGLPFVSLQWLRRLKQASGRTKDLLDLENLPVA